MQPKLRGTVSYAPTPDGIVFRVGDHFLPIKGKNVWRWFQRIKPLLDGRSHIERVCASWDRLEQVGFTQVVEGLKKANMLYDASLDDATLLPQAIQDRYRGLLSRIEVCNAQPIRVFSRVRSTHALIIGRVSLTLPVIDAGLESGLSQQILWALDWTSEADGLLTSSLQRHDAATLQLRVDRINHTDHSRLSELVREVDSVILAGVIGIDDAWLDANIESVLGSAPFLFTLLVAGDCIIVGEAGQSSATGCSACLMDYCKDLERSGSRASVSGQEAGIAIGSRLLLQRLFDVRTESLPREEHFMFHELNLHTFEMSRHPLPTNASCVRCRNTRWSVASENWPFLDHSARDIQVREFLERAEKCFVDPETGLIARLDEGDLLQFPHHQSAALRRPAQEGSRQAWITESGEDLYLARVAVIRRVLETHLTEQLASSDPHSLLSVYRSPREYTNKWSPAALPPGVVVSAVNSEDLVPEAFFRALAVYAHGSDGWSDAGFTSPSTGTEAELTLSYLDDIGVLNNIGVQRHLPLSTGGCDVLRFTYEGQCISVVAGLEGTDLCATGLKDVWLDVTAREAFPNDPSVFPIARFRCGQLPAELLSMDMSKPQSILGLHLGLVPLPWAQAKLTEPFFFTFAFVSDYRVGF